MALPIPIPPSFTTKQNEGALRNIVDRIFAERGHLRDIDNKSLASEIITEELQKARELEDVEKEEGEGEDGDGSDIGMRDGSSKNDEDDGETKTRKTTTWKELSEARQEMLSQVQSATNEALTLLDFVSLLLSKDSVTGQSSMSPALKQRVPIGSLGFDTISPVPLPQSAKIEKEDKERRETFNYNFESLNKTADGLLGAAKRLEGDMKRESRYWDGLLSVSEKGWNLCRMPGSGQQRSRSGRHGVGVKYGFLESAPQFRARGLAALNADEEGNLTLDKAAVGIDGGKHIRVRIQDVEGHITESSMSSFSPSRGTKPNNEDEHMKDSAIEEEEDLSLEEQVNRARDTLFAEELFHEATKEARDLFDHGVRVEDDVICLPLVLPSSSSSTPSRYSHSSDTTRSSKESKILIDIVPTTSVLTPAPQNGTNSNVADSVNIALQLLLTHAHRQKYRMRTLPPPPLSFEKTESRTMKLLEPLLCYLEHKNRVDEVLSTLDAFDKAMRGAGVDCAMKKSADPVKRAKSRLDKQINRPYDKAETEDKADGKPDNGIDTTIAHSILKSQKYPIGEILLDSLTGLLKTTVSLTIFSPPTTPSTTTSTISHSTNKTESNNHRNIKITITIKTFLSLSLYGTEYTLALSHPPTTQENQESQQQETSQNPLKTRNISEITTKINTTIRSAIIKHIITLPTQSSTLQSQKEQELEKARGTWSIINENTIKYSTSNKGEREADEDIKIEVRVKDGKIAVGKREGGVVRVLGMWGGGFGLPDDDNEKGRGDVGDVGRNLGEVLGKVLGVD